MSRHGLNIRKRKDGRWEARILIIESNGKKKYHSFYGNTFEEAKKKKELYYLQKTSNSPSLPNTQKKEPILFEQVIDEWKCYIEPFIKKTTYSKYVFYLNKNINPLLGKHTTKALSIEILDNFTNQLLSSGLSPKSVNGYLSVIKSILKFAEKRNYEVLSPKDITFVKELSPQIKILGEKEQLVLERFLLSHQSNVSIGVFLVLYTGLRIGEVCGLKWKDIDLQEKKFYINRTVSRIQNTDQNESNKTSLCFERPKTDCSKREIPISNNLLLLLSKEEKQDNFFFLTNTEKCMDPRNFYRSYQRILKECHLTNYTFHTLRHTFATRSIECGIDVKSVSEILGHKDVNITLRRYVHPSMESKREQMEMFAQKMSDKLKSI